MTSYDYSSICSPNFEYRYVRRVSFAENFNDLNMDNALICNGIFSCFTATDEEESTTYVKVKFVRFQIFMEFFPVVITYWIF